MKNVKNLPDGFYLITSPRDSYKCLVYLYDNPDFNGIRHIAFMPQDGAVLLPVTDLTEDSEFIPVCISRTDIAITTTQLQEI